MGRELLKQLLPAIEEMEWPSTQMSTGQGRQTFEVGLEKVYSYQEDPDVLLAALRIFQSGDSSPFACAGVAHTLVVASQAKDGTCSQAGLDQAMVWLEKAQEAEPDIIEINVIEALVYTCGGRLDDARIVLDYLQEQDPTNYHLNVAEVAYWRARNAGENVVHWLEQAMGAAVTVPQRLRMRTKLADHYLETGEQDKALAAYKEAVHFNKDNALLWHKISLIHWTMNDFEEADRCNRAALRLKNLPEARRLAAALKKKRSKSGLKGRLFGR
jgi:tetratricopeptide (TPR) repeat protein